MSDKNKIRKEIDNLFKVYLARTHSVNEFGLREKLLELFHSQKSEILKELEGKMPKYIDDENKVRNYTEEETKLLKSIFGAGRFLASLNDERLGFNLCRQQVLEILKELKNE